MRRGGLANSSGASIFRKVRTWLSERRMLVLLAVAVAVVLALGGLVGAGWYYSNLLRSGALEPDSSPGEPDLEVVALEEGLVTLRATERADSNGDWRKDGTFGLEWDGGYGQLGAIVQAGEEEVVRRFLPLLGTLKAGTPVRLDSFAFPGDPRQALGIPFREVTFPSDLGEFPAWLVPGTLDTWALFVHGKGANRREALRMLPAFVEKGLPSLVITYRNDEGAPPSPDGVYRYGLSEWEDLEAAARYAVDQGARRLVLVGYSMGGAIVVSFLYRSPLAERVVAAVLEAPMLDLAATIDWGTRSRGAPAFLSGTGRTIAGIRFDIDWGEVDYLARAGELTVPILLFHGDADPTVPVATSDALAAARPDIVTYVRVAGAGHVRSWNADPEAYRTYLREFLGGLPP
jgi:pimeloyl-ACP methyl ester carboxylesterase